MKRKIIAAFAALTIMATPVSATNIRIFSSDSLTREILESRTPDDVIIEVVIGKVLDSAGNGVTSENEYISYRDVGNAHEGNLVFTIMEYNNNNYVDDIVERYDFVIDID